MPAQKPSRKKTHKAGGSLSAQLHFEKKNKKQPQLPPNVVVQRRPINHPPIASPYVGAHVPKVIYVSTSTPLMATVKRVRKLLHQVEKRATSKIKIPDPKQQSAKKGDKEFLEAVELAAKEARKEAVYVKASGRAVEKALKVGEWLKEKDGSVDVKVGTGSAIVVDDLVEVEPESSDSNLKGESESGTTSMEVTANLEPKDEDSAAADTATTALPGPHGDESSAPDAPNPETSNNPRRKRKREMYDLDTMPEARTRWIKTVEVAISLKG
ncbi:MAG: hypothetical protein Q9160_007341 [Pyrenula sp. 1 TL-2023]